MHQIAPYPLWLGHVGDVRDLRRLLDRGVIALVDLAGNEPIPTLTRDLVYCRFPLVDGTGNPPWLLRLAIDTTASLLRTATPTLVYCSAGLSRSPLITAAALTLVKGGTPEHWAETIAQHCPTDCLPGLWEDVRAVVLELTGR